MKRRLYIAQSPSQLHCIVTLLAASAVAAYDFFFFFQAEDGIRDGRVTGVQTCALPICGAALSDAGVIAGRNIKHLLRTPQLLVFSVAQTVMFLLLFVYVFGGSIHVPGLTYVEYLIPGYLAQIAIFDGFGVSIFFAEDSKSGLIDRFRALPMARSAVVGGRAIADLLRQAALLAIVTGVAFLVGFSFHGS